MNEEIPSSFHKTVLHMIGKKGPADILKNNRFIHMKDFLPRTCEALVVNVMKTPVSIKLEDSQGIQLRNIYLL